MIVSKYKIEALVDNSFSKTIDELIKYLIDDIENISYEKSMSPDSVTVAPIGIISTRHIFRKPKHIYVTIIKLEGTIWTNQGGHPYCECIFKNGLKTLINWSTSIDSEHWPYGVENIDIKFFRKLKLKNIQKCQEFLKQT